MTRRSLALMGALFSAGCGGRLPAREPLPPVAGSWRRSWLAPRAREAAPVLVRQLGLNRAWEARYEGPAPVGVVCYEMTSPAVSFELAQRWRLEAGAFTFYRGSRFYVLTSALERDPALPALAESLDQALE